MTRFSSFGGRDSRSREWRRGNDDKRYHTGRYQRFRLRVLTRDAWRCFVPGCWKPGNVLDHVVPVYPGMPDDLFYSEGNARASCRRHNAARGWRTYADRETRSVRRGVQGDHGRLLGRWPAEERRRQVIWDLLVILIAAIAVVASIYVAAREVKRPNR